MTTMTKPKSVEVPKETLREFRRLVKRYRFLSQFLSEHKFDRNTTNSILSGKTVSPDTLERIEKLIEEKTAA